MIVDLEPTDDQRLIAESVGGMLAASLPVARLREASGNGAQPENALWSSLAELGLFGMGLPEEKGGFGYGLPEEMLAARELGLVLASPSVLAQMAAAHLADDGLRPAIMSGEARCAFASLGFDGTVWLYDGDAASHVVLLGDGAALLPRDAFGNWTAQVPMDETITLANAIAAGDLPARDNVAERISLLIAAATTGIAQAATAMAVDFAGQREQFGQPIGSFQAIKHSCADMAVRAAAADAQVRYCAITFGRTEDDRREIAAARWLATDAAIENAKANIQVHGGMGFTAECDAHLFLKRAHLFSALGSSRREEERRIIADAD
ncbi:acyl-CoA/acyl-ACP dehydrogenase [Sphingobium sp. AS12]|uniref:acyl-CoA dehydrogenase family protein n=1 Tax=Sphingobium sp. AS12 TaxID=2849495 RepID=UPI001C312E6A|nr:acyl-CoA dehydrogenase family protein [Sphingobium sp. AS12]MBV2149107.1 acyl-CoA/acyl-ACP dehydrogenase [Sphingobium sp. AS12]